MTGLRAYVDGVARDIPADPFAGWVQRADTAVLSIDMHLGHLSEDPMCPCPSPRGREIIAPVNAFHREARAMGVPIIHVRSVLRATGEDDLKGLAPAAWRSLVQLYADPIPGIDQHAIEGSAWTEFATEILEQDLIVQTKRRLSPFYPTDLDFLLRSMGVKHLVINGGMTDCCVLLGAFEASNLGYRVAVAADLVRGTSAELEHAALRMLSLHCALVMNSDAILEAWGLTG
ncbi:isochorismatase family cysteine hydrolase [Ahrensia marina]|uniref:cysteine hydrolase family protein n=1 Tax=Ahrensia marina TaxID=1514904 RepID=UPI0035D10B19